MGVKVKVDGVGIVEFADNFKDLDPDEQQKLVNQVAEMRKLPGGASKNDEASEPKRKTTNEDLLRAGFQGLMFGFQDEGVGLLKGLYEKAVEGKDFSEAYREARDDQRRKLEEFREADPVSAYGAEILGSLPTALAGGAALQAAKIGGKTLAGAASRAGIEGGAYGFGAGEGDAADQAKSAAIGAATGAGLTGAVGGALRSTIAPAATKEAQFLMDRGVRLTPGQQAPASVIGSFDLIAGKLPGARASQQLAVPDMNRAAMNEALKMIGKKAPKNKEGFELMEFGKKAFNDAYEDIKPKIHVPDLNGVKQQGYKILDEIRNKNPKAAKELEKQFAEILQIDGVGKKASLTGQEAKKFESILGEKGFSYISGSRKTDNPLRAEQYKAMSEGFYAMRDALRSRIVGKNAGDTAKLQRLNEANGKFQIIADASKRAGGGEFSPARLAQAVAAGDKGTGKRKLMTGDARLQDMSTAASTAIRSLPDSGTPLGNLAAGSVIEPRLASVIAADSLLGGVYSPIMRGILNTSRAVRAGTEAAMPAIGVGVGPSIYQGLLSE